MAVLTFTWSTDHAYMWSHALHDALGAVARHAEIEVVTHLGHGDVACGGLFDKTAFEQALAPA